MYSHYVLKDVDEKVHEILWVKSVVEDSAGLRRVRTYTNFFGPNRYEEMKVAKFLHLKAFWSTKKESKVEYITYRDIAYFNDDIIRYDNTSTKQMATVLKKEIILVHNEIKSFYFKYIRDKDFELPFGKREVSRENNTPKVESTKPAMKGDGCLNPYDTKKLVVESEMTIEMVGEIEKIITETNYDISLSQEGIYKGTIVTEKNQIYLNLAPQVWDEDKSGYKQYSNKELKIGEIKNKTKNDTLLTIHDGSIKKDFVVISDEELKSNSEIEEFKLNYSFRSIIINNLPVNRRNTIVKSTSFHGNLRRYNFYIDGRKHESNHGKVNSAWLCELLLEGWGIYLNNGWIVNKSNKLIYLI